LQAAFDALAQRLARRGQQVADRVGGKAELLRDPVAAQAIAVGELEGLAGAFAQWG
jgi:hypothetical protein